MRHEDDNHAVPVLIFIALCLLAALVSAVGYSFFIGTVAYAQVPGGLTAPQINRLSGMGRLAHLFATGQLGNSAAKVAVVAPAGDNVLTPGGQAQPSIAVDSTGRHIVIGTNNAAGFGLNPISVSGFQYSDDGGQTFTDGGSLPITTPTSSIGPTVYPEVFGDPEVKYLGGSNFIYFSIIVVNGGSSGPAQTLGFHLSRDFGHTWTGPFEIPPATNPNGLLNGFSVDLADKPFADVNPDTGRVLVSWSNFTPFAPGVEISTTFSDNILNANPVWSVRSIVAATPIDGQSSIPRFAGNGSANVYLAWQRFPADNNDTIGFARSTDNGATWGDPINAAPSAFFTMDQVLGNDRVSSAPGLAVDNSLGPRKGNIYLVYSNNNLRDGADIVFQSSTDGGLSFTSPVLINSRPGNDRAQWFPWVTVDNSSGRIYVFYYDQGIDTSGDLTQTTYQFSDDGGVTWKQPMPLTDSPFKAGWGKDQGHPNLGDYNQAVAQKGELFAAWAGTELLPFTSGLPSVHMNTPKVFFKGVPASSAKVSLTSNFSGTTFTDSNGNGFIDAGEQVAFKFPLTNYVTNPILQPTVITGIVATLSTAMPAVTIVQGTSGYPSIAPGASGSNDRDFIIQLSPSYARGTPLDLVLNVTSNQGTTVLLFTHSTGTAGATTLFQENFDSTTPGTLPAGWLTQHVGGSNTVPWTTSNTFNPGNNGAFHTNANDGPASDATRWERFLSPIIVVPPDSEYVTLDFDVKHDTQDDPNFNILAYDGFLLRIGDYGPSSSPPAFVRSVMAEAFEEEFTTSNQNHYPKHFPRSNNTRYFQDISAWAGDSAGLKHVHMKLNGMAGRSIRLWWEFTQDANLTCNDVRPAARACGVLFDNVVVQSVVTIQADLSVTKSITSGPAISGQNITYRIDATNNGPTLNVSSTVTDDLSPLLSFVSCSVTGGGTCNSSDNHQTVTLPPGAPGFATIALVTAIGCSAAGGTPLSNTATISSSTPDPDPSNNFSTAATKIVNPPPVMSCPADIVTTAQPGQTSVIANFAVTATDNCPLQPGTIVATPASGSPFLVGTTKVTATATDSGGAQSSCSFNVTVNAPTTADQTITFAALSRHVYGDAPFSLNATSSSGLAVSFNVTGNCSLSGNSLTITGAGICTVTASQPGDVNYNPAQDVSQIFAINRTTALMRADNRTRVYGSVNPEFTASYSGFVNGDTPANLSGVMVFTTAATAVSNVGLYAINLSGLTSPNYNITFIPGTLTVTQAPLTLTANPVARYFGVNNPPLTVTFVGLLNNDTITATGVTTATPTSPPGSYPITIPLLNVVDPGRRLSNYAVTNPALPGGYATNGLLTVVLTYAVYVTKIDCAALGFSGQSFTDSFDSSKGSYANTHVNMRGDIAVNGNAELKREAVINGSLYTPFPEVSDECDKGIPGITISGDAVVKGVPPYVKLTPISFTTSPATRVSAGPSDLKVTSDRTLVPDDTSPNYRDIVVAGKATLTLESGVYNINSLTLQGNATVVAQGPVILNIAGGNPKKQSGSNNDQNQGEDDGSGDTIKVLYVNGGSVISASGPSGNPNPADLLIVYWGAGEIDLAGQSHSYGVLYAPNAAVKLKNRADWYGAMVVNDLDAPEHTAIHYDLNLGR